MQESIEKAYFFSKKEFLVLLGIAGLQEIYSFELPKDQEITSEELIYALYQLIQKGLITMEGKPSLSPEMGELTAIIQGGQFALSAVPGKDKDQLIAYVSPEGIVAMESCPDKGGLRIGRLLEEDLWQRLSGEESLGLPLLESEEEGDVLERCNEGVRQEREAFEELALPPMEEEIFSIMEKGQALAAWVWFDLTERKTLKRFLFLKGGICSWILKEDEEGRLLTPDSGERRQKLRQEIFSL